MSTHDVKPDQSQVYLARCLELFGGGAYAEADAEAEAAVGRFPDDGRLWQLRGLLRQRLGDLAGACTALETAASLVPLESASRCALADCYARLGKAELARDLYRYLARDARCPAELLPAVASGLGGLGDDESALEACRELLRRDPGRPEAHFGAAYYLRRLGYPAEAALPLVARAHELAPRVTLFRVAFASLLAHLGRQAEAYDLLCDVDPGLIRCGCCLRRMMAIFGSAGDVARLASCRARAEQIGCQGGRDDASRP